MGGLRNGSMNNVTNLLGRREFSFDRLLAHVDPGPAEESEAFVRGAALGWRDSRL